MSLFFKFFPTPKYLKMPTAGIDITQFSVNLISLEAKEHSLEVSQYASADLKYPVNFSEDISKHTNLVDILTEWKKKYNLQFIEASLPEERAYLFETKVPIGSEAEMRSSIEFSLEENVPISPAESIFDFRLIGDVGNGEVVVAVTVLPEEVVQNYIDLFAKAGLTPLSFLIEPQALSKAVIKGNDMNAYFLVNIRESKTGLFVVSQDSVQFTSTIQIGSRNFTEGIAKQFNITPVEAEKMKKEKGFVKTKENSEMLSAMAGPASVLKEEIERVYVYWHTHKGVTVEKPRIQKIILCGDDASVPGFVDHISQSIKVPAEIGNIWTNVCSFDDYIPPISFEDSLRYGPAIGLALPRLHNPHV